jgi:hypothetical protein
MITKVTLCTFLHASMEIISMTQNQNLTSTIAAVLTKKKTAKTAIESQLIKMITLKK